MSWPVWGGPNLTNDRYYAGDTHLTLDGAATGIAKLTQKWVQPVNGGSRVPVILSGGLAYVIGDGGRAYVRDAASGTEIWHYDVPGSPKLRGCSALFDNLWTFGGDDGKVYGLDITTHLPAAGWPYDLIGTGGAPAGTKVRAGGIKAGGYRIQAADDGRLRAFNANGTVAWATLSNVNLGAVTTALAYWNGAVYATGAGGFCASFDVTTGALLRTFNTRGSLATAPVIFTDGNGVTWLLLGSTDHYLYAFLLAGGPSWASVGDLIWRNRQDGDVLCAPAVSVPDSYVLMGLHDWNIEAHVKGTGKVHWIFSGHNSAAILDGLAVVDCQGAGGTTGRAVFGSYPVNDGRAVGWQVVHATGGYSPDWKSGSIGSGQFGQVAPTFDAGLLYLPSDDGNVYAFGL